MLKNTIIIYRIIKIINHWEGKFYKQDYYVGMRFEQMLEGNCLEKENNDLFLLLRIRLLKKYTHASFLKARLVLDRKSRGRMEWPVHIRSRTSCRNSSVGTPPRSDLPPPPRGGVYCQPHPSWQTPPASTLARRLSRGGGLLAPPYLDH